MNVMARTVRRCFWVRTPIAILILCAASSAAADSSSSERAIADLTVAAGMGVAMVDGHVVGAFGPHIAAARSLERFTFEGQYQVARLVDDSPGGTSGGWAHRLGAMAQYAVFGGDHPMVMRDRFRGYVELGGGRQWVDMDADGPSYAGIDMRAKIGTQRVFLLALHFGVRADIAPRPGPSDGVDVSVGMIFGSGISW